MSECDNLCVPPENFLVFYKLPVTTNTDNKRLTSGINKLLVIRSTNLLAKRQQIYKLLDT